MIRPLRSRHRMMFLAIALIGWVLLFVALSGDRPIPRVESIPTAVQEEAP